MSFNEYEKKADNNYLLSLSDLFSGILFIFILVLMYFVLKVNNEKNNLTRPLEERGKMLKKLKSKIEEKGIIVSIDEREGILRLQDNEKGKGCRKYFKSAEYKLTKCGKKNFRKIKKVFMDILPCYAHKDFKKFCKEEDLRKDKKLSDLLDTILIEGHTDKVQIGSSLKLGIHQDASKIKDNLELSAKRSASVFRFMLDYKEGKKDSLLSRLHSKKQKIFGISGFSKFRLLGEDKKKNRRIDIRFIMSKPKDVLDEVKKRLNDG